MPNQAIQMAADVGLQEITLRPIQDVESHAPKILTHESQRETTAAREDFDKEFASKTSSDQPLI